MKVTFLTLTGATCVNERTVSAPSVRNKNYVIELPFFNPIYS